MADISNIQIGSGTYDIKDSQARTYIENNIINVKLYGVTGDGTTDDTQAIQNCINNHPNCTIFFPKGTYAISSPISLKRANNFLVNIKMDTNAIIKNISTSIMSCLFEVGYDYSEGEHVRWNIPNVSYIEGGILDCQYVSYGIKVFPLMRLLRINNVNFYNISNCGLLSDYGVNSEHISGDLKVENCYFLGLSSNESNSVGMRIHSSDNEFVNIRIDRTKKAIECTGWGNYFSNIHCTAMFTGSPTYDERNATICFDCQNNNSFNSFIECYNDTYATGFKSAGGSMYLTNCINYWYYSDANTIYNCVHFTSMSELTTFLKMVNCNFNLPSNGTNTHIKLPISTYLNNGNVDLVNCNFNYNSTLSYKDPAFCVQANNLTAINCDVLDHTLLDQNQNVFYPIAIIDGSASVFDYNVQYLFGNYAKVKHNLTSFISKDIIKTGINLYLSVIDVSGTYYLCVSTDNVGQHKNICLSNIMNNKNIKFFARPDFFDGVKFENVAAGNIKFKQLLNS